MIGTVQEIGKSNSGKPKVKIEGKYYSAGRCSIDGMSVGMKVDFSSSTFDWNGKTMYGLESWKPVGNGAPAGNGSQGAPSDDAVMRFISNCVGQAIAAGTIKEPGDITIWYQAAKRAATLQPEFDDEPNF